MPRGAGDSPGALLLAGVFVRPVGAGDGATGGCHFVVTAGCGEVSEGKGLSRAPSAPRHPVKKESKPFPPALCLLSLVPTSDPNEGPFSVQLPTPGEV